MARMHGTTLPANKGDARQIADYPAYPATGPAPLPRWGILVTLVEYRLGCVTRHAVYY